MKVLAVIFFVVGLASARGSGPYLPSGWRPQGPAFFLPSEVQQTSPVVPLKAAPIQESESEASGSDFLREYGPPKVQEVSQDITQQGLPDAVTEQSFVVIEAKFGQDEDFKGSAEEALTEEVSATESLATVEEKTEVADSEPILKGKSIDFETQTVIKETSSETLQNDVESTEKVTVRQEEIVSGLEEREKVEEEVKTVSEGVKNIAEALINLENGLKVQQVQDIKEATAARASQESSGSSQQTPEGFLEYGPPGFREYGPPKQGDLLRSSLVAEEQLVNAAIENNETRRRRFSPKFKASPRRRIH